MTSDIVLFIIRTLIGIFGLAMGLLIIALPFLFVYAVYRAIKALMTHNAELKNRYGNNGNQDTENRWTSGQ